MAGGQPLARFDRPAERIRASPKARLGAESYAARPLRRPVPLELRDALVGLFRDLQICGCRTAHDLHAYQAGGQNKPVANGFVNKMRHVGRQIHTGPFADNPD